MTLGLLLWCVPIHMQTTSSWSHPGTKEKGVLKEGVFAEHCALFGCAFLSAKCTAAYPLVADFGEGMRRSTFQ